MTLALWFLPRQTSPFTSTAQELISQTIPQIFLSPSQQIQDFPPHVTITSGISLSEGDRKDPQEWLNALDCSAYRAEHNEIILELLELQTEDPFFRKCNISLSENKNLRDFAEKCRAAAGLEPMGSNYRPHFSLFYGDVATKDVQAKLPLIEMKVGFAIGDLFACCGGALCLGGEMVLVDTSRPITAWKEAVVAKREVPWVMWRASKHLA